MNSDKPVLYIAFEGDRQIASGPVGEVALATKKVVDRGAGGPVLVFDATTSQLIELDLRGTLEEVRGRYPFASPPSTTPEEPVLKAPRRGPGRPRLGVVAREVTLLPRHWTWLGSQRGGASATIRRLVEHARKGGAGRDRVHRAQGAVYGFMSAMAGDKPGFEEAIRALFVGDAKTLEHQIADWPPDVRNHCRQLALEVFRDPDVV